MVFPAHTALDSARKPKDNLSSSSLTLLSKLFLTLMISGVASIHGMPIQGLPASLTIPNMAIGVPLRVIVLQISDSFKPRCKASSGVDRLLYAISVRSSSRMKRAISKQSAAFAARILGLLESL